MSDAPGPKHLQAERSEMTDEQLAGLYAPVPKREPVYLLTPEGGWVLWFLATLIALGLVFWINR